MIAEIYRQNRSKYQVQGVDSVAWGKHCLSLPCLTLLLYNILRFDWIIVSMLCSLKRNVCLCSIATTTAAIPADELFPPLLRTIVNFTALHCVYSSVKTVCSIGSREASHCPKYTHTHIYMYN